MNVLCNQSVPSLTSELRFDLPGTGGKAPKNLSFCVSDKQQGGATLCQASHHPGEALPMQLCRKHKSPGGAVVVWQLERLTESW